MRPVFLGSSFALLSIAVSGVIVTTYSSILVEHALVKQLEQRQSTISDGWKIAGKSLHQHEFPSEISPQLKGVPQVEQFLTLMLYIL